MVTPLFLLPERRASADPDGASARHSGYAGGELQERMAEVGFVAGTQVAYLREFDRFEKKLDRKTAATATVRDARRYLSRLKQRGVSKTAYSNASAVLKFFFEEVRGLAWNPISPLRERMIEDMHLHRFSAQDAGLLRALGRGVGALLHAFARSARPRRTSASTSCT